MDTRSSDSIEDSRNAVFVKSKNSAALKTPIEGYKWDKNGIDYEKILKSYGTTGLQASNLSLAIDEINRMVDCIVTSAGGVEEDLIKCLAPTFLGDFQLDGRSLREQGINRIGNMLVPNDNYCKFENWVTPILDQMVEEQTNKKLLWTPSKVIERLGREINDENSVYYWCYTNEIPVFCPALTDGSLGDMMFFHSIRNPGLVLDILGDLRRLNQMAIKASHSGMIIIGGSVIKHHICNANLMRNGADYSVFINTASEFDGSDSGAKPDEAISWGKIKMTAEPVKVYADASLVFPLIVAETFAKEHFSANVTS
ncbi:probable deoxyhypusine synthase isoform X2 [Artemia franciscana]|uniref:probable deoxyhypusine synthase isoform X2 n=1 Tax=Artemia franciscana TaxID=6661 RepID=UPI0032DBE318